MTSEVLAAGDAPTSDDTADDAADGAPVPSQTALDEVAPSRSATSSIAATVPAALEIGGREGPEPTRYGDWEMRGRCIDF